MWRSFWRPRLVRQRDRLGPQNGDRRRRRAVRIAAPRELFWSSKPKARLNAKAVGKAMVEISMNYLGFAPRSTGASLRRIAGWSAVWLLFFLVIGGSGSARAEKPIAAQAEVSGSKQKEGAKLVDRAISKARRAALDLALEQLSVPVPTVERNKVLNRYRRWTSSYRVLNSELREDGAIATVEAEIDLARLAKQIAPPKARPKPMYQWGGVRLAKECERPNVSAASIETTLRQAGIVSDSASTRLSLQLRCSFLGPVSFRHVLAARVEAELLFGASKLNLSASGFDRDPGRALDFAQADLFSLVIDRLRGEADVDLQIRVHEPWPARRLRHLERLLRKSVGGVESASLVALTSEGDAILELRSTLDAMQLGEKLSVLHFPGFEIEELRVSSPRSLSLRFSGGPGDQPIDLETTPADRPQM